jgi:hypothetical protein
MPKFLIEVSFDLTSEIEVETSVHDFIDPSGVEDLDDDCYFQSVPVTSSGGNLKFTLEGEDEDDVLAQAEERIHDGQEIEDRNGLTWLIDSTSIEVEPVEEPMTKERAIGLVSEFLRTSDIPEDVKDAIRFLIVTLAS